MSSRVVITRNIIRIAIGALVSFGVLCGIAVAMPLKTRAVWLYLTGCAGRCGLSQSLEAATLGADHIAAKNRILAGTKLIEKDPKGFTYWDTPRGRYWMPMGGIDGLQSDLAEQARGIYGRNGRGVRPGDVVLDCGANVGVYTWTSLAAGAKLVVAIEPAPENLECLRRNFSREIAAGRVVVYPKGVWDKDDFLALYSSSMNSTADSLIFKPFGSDLKKILVPLTTIDKVVAELKLPRVDFIKMDIEGAETKAILGARETIRTFRPRMALCVYHKPEDPVLVPGKVREIVPEYRVHLQPFMSWSRVFQEVALFE